MKNKKRMYHIFFPENKVLPFPKTRWMIMIILQELRMFKFKAVIKYYIKPSYRKDINYLRDILSKDKLKGTKDVIPLFKIGFSHEINYPKWVDKIEKDIRRDPENYRRIKVFHDDEGYIVIDGNHRLQAMRRVFPLTYPIRVLRLTYKN